MKIKEVPFTKVYLLKLKSFEIKTKINKKQKYEKKKLLEKFNKVCKAYSTEIGSDSEFMSLCTSLQDNGLIDVKKSKEIRNSKVSCLIRFIPNRDFQRPIIKK